MRSGIFLTAVLAILAATFSWTAKGEDQNRSIQEQLNDLKKGQQQILQELEALRSAIQQAPARSEVQARPAGPTIFNVRGEPFKGTTNASVAIVEYSDFDCSHCAQFAAQTFPEIDRKYILTGKIRYFFRDLPEPGNAESLLKAHFARCAGDQGKFWLAHDYLFLRHPTLTGSNLESEARELGLDATMLTTCLKDPKYTIMIQRSAAGAARMRIQGTPTFFVGSLSENGDLVEIKESIVGLENTDILEKAIEKLLAPSKPGAPPGLEKK
jgi:protein-disulfide isomerase